MGLVYFERVQPVADCTGLGSRLEIQFSSIRMKEDTPNLRQDKTGQKESETG